MDRNPYYVNVRGSCENNGRDGAYASYGGAGSEGRDVSGGVSGRQTNVRGDMQGMNEAIREGIRDGASSVHVGTSQRFIADAVNQGHLDTWADQGYKRSSGSGRVSNQDQWNDFRQLSSEIPVEVSYQPADASSSSRHAMDLARDARGAGDYKGYGGGKQSGYNGGGYGGYGQPGGYYGYDRY